MTSLSVINSFQIVSRCDMLCKHFFKRVIKRKYILNIMVLNYCSYKFLIILSLNKKIQYSLCRLICF